MSESEQPAKIDTSNKDDMLILLFKYFTISSDQLGNFSSGPRINFSSPNSKSPSGNLFDKIQSKIDAKMTRMTLNQWSIFCQKVIKVHKPYLKNGKVVEIFKKYASPDLDFEQF